MSVKVAKDGMVVGKYELGKTIGEGSFAKVKLARNVKSGNKVAIKILDRKHVLRHNMMEQLQREISTMKLINHPNVAKIFEVTTLHHTLILYSFVYYVIDVIFFFYFFFYKD